MSQITDVTIWADVGYTDGCSEIPPIGHQISATPIYQSESGETFSPSKDRMFTELQLPVDYLTLMSANYLRLTVLLNNSENMTFYGWIDGVSLHSDNTGRPMTKITWHTDPWRTFNQYYKFGSGLVVRRPYDPDKLTWQNYPYNYKIVDEAFELLPLETLGGSKVWWALVCRQIKDNNKVTRVQWMTFPVRIDGGNVYAKVGNDTIIFPNYADVALAQWDEKLAINPDTITGCWIIPVRTGKFTFHGAGSYNDPLIFDSPATNPWQMEKINNRPLITTRAQLEDFTITDLFNSGTIAPNTPIKSTETAQKYVVGFNGERVAALPFDMAVNEIFWRVVANSVSCYIEFRCNDGINANAEGLCFNAAVPTIDCNSNSWSSYVYSGQRDYDIQQRTLKSNQSAIEGAVSSVSGNFLSGGFLGGVLQPSGKGKAARANQLTNMSIGAGIGAAAGLIGTGIQYGLDMMVFNDQFQAQEDFLHAHQADGILMTGIGADCIMYGRTIAIATMEIDPVGVEKINGINEVQGVTYNAPVPDCTDLIEAGGPMQIANLIVTGNVPSQAKIWVKQKFADGVRIVARSADE